MAGKSDNIYMGGEIGNSGRTRSATLEKLPDNPQNFTLQQFKTPVYEKVQGSAKKDVWGALAMQLSQDIGGYLHEKAQKYEQLRRNNVLTDVQTESHAFAQEYKRKTPSGSGLTEATLKTFDATLEKSIKEYSDDEKDLIRISASSLKRSIAKSYANEEKNLVEDFTVVANAKYQNALLNSIYLHPEQEPQLRKLYDANTENLKGTLSASTYEKVRLKDHKAWVLRLGEGLIDRDPKNWQRVLDSERFRGADADTVYNLKKHGERQADRLEKKIHRDVVEADIAFKRQSFILMKRMDVQIARDPFSVTEHQINSLPLVPEHNLSLMSTLIRAQKKEEKYCETVSSINKHIEKSETLDDISDEDQNKFMNQLLKDSKTATEMSVLVTDIKATAPIKKLEGEIKIKLKSKDPASVMDGAKGLVLAQSGNSNVVKNISDEYTGFANFILQSENAPLEQQVQAIERGRQIYLQEDAVSIQERKNIEAKTNSEIRDLTDEGIAKHAVESLTDMGFNPKVIVDEDWRPNFVRSEELHPLTKERFKSDAVKAYRAARLKGMTAAESRATGMASILRKTWSVEDDNGFKQLVKNHPHVTMPEYKKTYAVKNYTALALEDVVRTAEKSGNLYPGVKIKLDKPLLKDYQSKDELFKKDLRTSKDNTILVMKDGKYQKAKVYIEFDDYGTNRAKFFFLEDEGDWSSYRYYLFDLKTKSIKDAGGKTHVIKKPDEYCVDFNDLKSL